MKFLRSATAIAIAVLASAAHTQNWVRPYEEGLAAARKNEWSAARTSFQSAASLRQQDSSSATNLPGPPTERRRWRNGSPYSPNFLAAYAMYRQSLLAQKDEERTQGLQTAAAEFESLLEQGQTSPHALYYLYEIYGKLGEGDRQTTLQKRIDAKGGRLDWQVDTEVIPAVELSAINAAYAQAAPSKGSSRETTPTIRAEDLRTGTGTTNSVLVPGRVMPIPNKFALIIGNSDNALPGSTISFAATDAQRVSDTLINSAGYPEANVVLLQNASSETINEKVKELVSRLSNDATVFIYFCGAGSHVKGTDYLAGTDATTPDATGSMISKNNLYTQFLGKGARIFAFYQVGRKIGADGGYFGGQIPLGGSIAQVQATLPGEDIGSVIVNGNEMGAYTSAMIETLQELKSNRIPILEFGRQVFYRIRRGNTGTTGGGSRQTPTLPVLTNLASDARF